jgi:predicted PurR-regulated permease PerM
MTKKNPDNLPFGHLDWVVQLIAFAALCLVVTFVPFLQAGLPISVLMLVLLWPWRKNLMCSRVLWLVGFLGLFQVLSRLGSAMTPLIAGLLLAYIMEPLVKALPASFGRTRSAGLVLLLFLALGCGLAILVSPVLFEETKDLIARVPAMAKDFELWLRIELPLLLTNFGFEGEEISKWLWENAPGMLKSTFGTLGRGSQTLVSGLAGFTASMINLILVPLFAFYISANVEKITRWFDDFLYKEWRSVVNRYAKEVNTIFSGFFRGQIMVSSIVASLTWLGLWLSDISWPLLLGIATGVLNVIPLIGVGFMFFVSMIVALFSPAPLIAALKVAIVFAVVQGLESTVITPRILGRSVGLHPGIALLALLMFGSLFGLPGMILAVPLAAIMLYFLGDLKRSWLKHKNSIEGSTEDLDQPE